MTDSRIWSCMKTEDGYLITLFWDEYQVSRFVDNHTLRATGSVNSYFEYQIIRLNKDLCEKVFPLTRFLEERIFPT